MRPAYLLILSILIILLISSSVSAYTVRPDHPRVFINSDNIDDIRARCIDANGVQDDYYSYIKSSGDSVIDDGETGYEEMWLYSFLYLMGEIPGYTYDVTYNGETGIEAYGARGVDILKARADAWKDAAAGHYEPVMDMAIGYDWLYDKMTPEERAAIVQDFISFHENNVDYINSNSERLLHAGGLYIRGHVFLALAWYGDGSANHPGDPASAAEDDANATKYLDDYISIWEERVYPVWERITKGGGYPFGSSYDSIWQKYLIKGAMWDTATYDDFWNDYDGYPKYSLFFMLYNLIPYNTFLHCDSSYNPEVVDPVYRCYEGCYDVRALDTRDTLRYTGSTLLRFGDMAYPCFNAPSSTTPLSVNSITVNEQQGNADIAQVSKWMLLYHGSTETPPSVTELSEGPYHIDRWSPPYYTLVRDIVLRDEDVVARSPMDLELPTSYMFGTIDTGPSIGPDFSSGSPEGTGIVSMRSAWEDTNATLVFYKHSPYAPIHFDADAGQFQIYKNGWLAIDSGQYEETNHASYYKRTTNAKNSLVVYDPDEDWGHCPDSFSVCGNSGGQRFTGAGNYDGLVNVQSDPLQFYGGIRNYEHEQNEFTYIDSDLTRAYQSTLYTDSGNSPKVSKVTRQLVYLPDDFVVVFDRIDATEGSYPKRWLLHSVYRPELDGSESFSGTIQYSDNIPGKPSGVQLQGDMDAGISESYNTDTFYVDAYNFEHPLNDPATGRLFVKTLLPESRIHRVVGGPGYEFMNAEYDNYPIHSTIWWRSQHPEHGSWRVEVEPAGTDYGQEYNTFLHVIEARGTQTSSTMVPSELIESTSGQEMQGAVIDAYSGSNKIVMFAREPDVDVISTSFDIPISGQADLLVVDLVPDTDYYYRLSGTGVEISTSENGGTLKHSSPEGTLSFTAQLSSFGYVLCTHDSDTGTHDCPVYAPDYPTKPDKGESVTDTSFHTTITRISDTSTEVDNFDPSSDRGLSFYYSTANSENSDGTYILAIDHSNGAGWHLYDAVTLEHLERLTDLSGINGDGWPRWDAADPDVFYFTDGASMFRYDLSQPLGSRISLVHDFTAEYPSATRVDWRDEGTPSEDTRYWALCVMWDMAERYVISYDKETDAVLGEIDVSLYSGDTDWVAMSPSGDYIVVRWAYYSQDIWRWNRDGTGALALTGNAGHSAPAKTLEGDDVWIYFDEGNNNWITMVDMQGQTTKLVEYERGCSIGGHFNGANYNKPGWAIVGTMCSSPDPATHTGWIDAGINMIELKEDPRVFRVAHHRAPYVTYWSSPFANFNRDGTRIYFGSNWGTDDDTNNDIYRIDLPSTWYEDLSGFPLDTCQSLGHHCCDSCQSGTEQTQYDGNCSGQVCCGECSELHRADTSEPFGCITMPELSAFINLWFAGSQGVTMPELMQGVTLWKAGTGC